MVSEPIKGKAPRVDHHNLIPAHLNEELYLWQEISQKNLWIPKEKGSRDPCKILAALFGTTRFFLNLSE